MRALQAVPVLLASLVAAATAPAHGTGPQRHGAKAAPVRRAHTIDTREATRSRTGDRDPFMCDRVAEQNKGSVVMRSHRIVRGDSLSGIAALYGTTVPALAAANGLRANAVIRTGQELVIPQQDRPGGGNDWLKYARSPEEPGTLTLTTYKSHFHGRVLEKGRLSTEARAQISTLLGVKGSQQPQVPDRLLRLLVRVSDTFGGRPIRVVSGYRTSSYFSDSRHKQSAAIDFSIYGVPNAVVRQYLLLFENVGVGYYPNSSFVHLDVRPCAMQWVDYAGPGEAPRLRPSSPRFANRPTVSDLDEIAEGVAAVLDRTKGPELGRAPAPELPTESAPLHRAAPPRAAAPNDDVDSDDPP
jgi:uncharacterized protein YcbK (DUF882 family)